MGTTWTRFRNWLEASLLTMTAGRVFLISPPTAGPKRTHHTSPRIILHLAESPFRPLQRLGFAAFLFGQFAVGRFELAANHVGPRQFFQEAADPPAPDRSMQTSINVLADGNGEFPLHGTMIIRIVYVFNGFSAARRRRRARISSRRFRNFSSRP